jgi:lipid II:glycine glycyltransferase (peptidoglycan interpeptide bridge formation enzyme)
MGFQEVFPKILEKTYPNCQVVYKSSPIPFISVKSKLFGNKVVSLPFLDTIRLNKKITEKDLAEIASSGNKVKIEIRASESDPNLKRIEKVLLKKRFHRNIVKGHIISKLTSEKDFWGRFHKHTRNDIRKAEKSRLKVRRIESLEDLEEFYALYLRQMKRFGTPQHSYSFFKNCLELMKKDFYGLNCYLDGKLVASIMLFIEGDYAYVPFNVSEPKYRSLRVNDLIYWEAIKWCMTHKIHYFDIGQVDLNTNGKTREESLLKFKNKWLGEVYRRVYFTRNFKYDFKKKSSLKKFRVIWRRLPLIFIRVIGPKICSQMG